MAKAQATKNDKAWAELFEQHNILKEIKREGSFLIRAEQINRFREARLMTKFDHRRNLPELFRHEGLSILPITRGSYLIAPFELYHEFEPPERGSIPKRIGFPHYIESIDSSKITSEATAINCAYVTGILAHFTGEEQLLPTVSGRMSSGTFRFMVDNRGGGSPFEVAVENSQLEIDGGYEGRRSLTLIEAKNSISDDFLIRQLYYPYRLWSANMSKEIKSIFLIYSNGIFTLYEYRFREPGSYNSISLIKQQDYTIESSNISLEDLSKVALETATVPEPQIAFPQADSFRRVINLCELLNERGELTADEITYNYDFDARQTTYYTDAGRYLGIISKERDERGLIYRLTSEGKRLFDLKLRARQLKFVELILRHEPFKSCFFYSIKRGGALTKDETVEFMKRADLYNINSESTFRRRASTVIGWIKWILTLKREEQPGLFEGL